MPHVGLGVFERCLRGRLTPGGHLKGRSNTGKVTAHLWDIRHYLTVLHRYLQLPQKRVIFSHLLVQRAQRWNADWLCPSFGEEEFGVLNRLS
jgi:hypothetical protein